MGLGLDAHRLAPGIPLVLGGVPVPHDSGLEGYSDGDVLVHAVIDALLGAAGLGDIGSHYPPGDARYRGARSTDLLSSTAEMLRREQWKVINVDATIAAERPRLSSYTGAMREAIAAAAGLRPEQVGVKATTTDGLGFAGRGEGMGAMAVALVEAAG